jgi:thiamine-monophosphate kinase
MNELDIIRELRKLGKGIGDDCAILAHGRQDLLITTDLFIEGVHFLRAQKPEDLGHRALARSLSDLAAMGADALCFLVSLALAPWSGPVWRRRFYRGMMTLANRHGVELAGGDLARADTVVADVVAIGAAPRGKALKRSGARPGDYVWVSGSLGGQPVRPEPRLDLGRWLRSRATACIDLSDGLSLDLHRLCLESGIAAEIDRPLPLAPGASLEDGLHRGEDYELLFTSPSAVLSYRSVRLTCIGRIVAGKPGRVTLFGKPLRPAGYDHFAKRSS